MLRCVFKPLAGLAGAALLMAGLASAALAESCRLTEPGAVVSIDGERLPLTAVELLEKLASPGGKKVPRSVLVASLVDNRLLARRGFAELGKEALFEAPEVGFDRRFLIEQRVAGVFRSLYEEPMEAFIRQQLNGRLSTLVDEHIESRLKEIAGVLAPANQLLEVLDPQQIAQAKDLRLARYRFPGGKEPRERHYSLWDLYSTQNVQNRIRLHRLDLSVLATALDAHVAAAFVQDWVAIQSGLGAQEIEWIERYVTDGQMKLVYLNSLGLARDLHSDNPPLNQVRNRLTQAEIRAYYDKNKEQFRRTESVRARHLRVPDEQTAAKAYKAVRSGMSFDEAVRAFSIAPSKHATPAGDLGLMDMTQGERGWLKSATAALRPGEVSRPIRAPAKPGEPAVWEIFYIDERNSGYYAPDSETVRYLAGQALASRKLIEAYQSLRAELYHNATICVNPDYVALNKESIMETSARASVSGGL